MLCFLNMLILKDTYQIRRLQAIKNLGGECVACSECCEMVLEFDHKDNDGKAQRKEKTQQYLITSQLAFGVGLEKFQLLCANCHRIKTKLERRFGRAIPITIQKIRETRANFVRTDSDYLKTIAESSSLALTHPDGTPATKENPIILD